MEECSVFSTAVHTPNVTNTLNFISHHLKDHITIIATFLVLMNNVQKNMSGRRLWTILEGIYESLRNVN